MPAEIRPPIRSTTPPRTAIPGTSWEWAEPSRWAAREETAARRAVRRPLEARCPRGARGPRERPPRAVWPPQEAPAHREAPTHREAARRPGAPRAATAVSRRRAAVVRGERPARPLPAPPRRPRPPIPGARARLVGRPTRSHGQACSCSSLLWLATAGGDSGHRLVSAPLFGGGGERTDGGAEEPDLGHVPVPCGRREVT